MDLATIAQERRERLEFDRWVADRDTRGKAMGFASSLTDDERAVMGGPIECAKMLEQYLRHG